MKLVKDAEQVIRDQLCSRLKEYIEDGGGRPAHLNRQQSEFLLDICPDADLLATAILMEKRPQWVKAVLGDKACRP